MAILKKFNIGVTRYSTLHQMWENGSASRDIDFILKFKNNKADELLKSYVNSKSELRQDLFVLTQLDFKKSGFFVEFGATNGVSHSNTYLLEKHFGWRGILAEPAICWHKELRSNRNCNIEAKCVWKISDTTVQFSQAQKPTFSTINNFLKSDLHQKNRLNGSTYNVNTISLFDLLQKYNAPRDIDYLSIDTEGSEFEILNSFDFSTYCFSVITCEHNYTPMRDKIFSLLTSKGYKRVFEDHSYFDDWYIKEH